jgi:hypothetical protein
MRASPYDFSALGYGPIRIEIPEGRAEYESLQQQFARTAKPFRERLIAVCEQIIHGGDVRPEPSRERLANGIVQ